MGTVRPQAGGNGARRGGETEDGQVPSRPQDATCVSGVCGAGAVGGWHVGKYLRSWSRGESHPCFLSPGVLASSLVLLRPLPGSHPLWQRPSGGV